MGKDLSEIPEARKICGERLPMKSKKEPPSSPFSQLSFIHYFFTALLVYYHENSLHYHGNCRLLRDSIFLPQSPSYQRHQKRKKERLTNHSGEPLYTQNPLILSHSSTLLPTSTQNPMALFLNCRLCRC